MEIRGNRLGKNEREQQGMGEMTAEMRSGGGKRTDLNEEMVCETVVQITYQFHC